MQSNIAQVFSSFRSLWEPYGKGIFGATLIVTKKETLSTLIKDNRLEEVYVFGSWLRSEIPNDVDLLIVFDPQKCSFAEAAMLRRQIAEAIFDSFDLAGDIVLLTVREEEQADFVCAERCVPLSSVILQRDLTP
jgi:predicted nucleotidyltransferase